MRATLPQIKGAYESDALIAGDFAEAVEGGGKGVAFGGFDGAGLGGGGDGEVVAVPAEVALASKGPAPAMQKGALLPTQNTSRQQEVIPRFGGSSLKKRDEEG
ncbi:hypothetical protein KEM55_009258 [Ascosphaera atra]|nr:hypothetical protein KEM55_009258 [Ascosphaera atra]